MDFSAKTFSVLTSLFSGTGPGRKTHGLLLKNALQKSLIVLYFQ